MTATDKQPLFVHLSDIHFDERPNTTTGPNAVCREQLLLDLAEGAAELGRPDAILVTGDIAYSGLEHEYAQARQFLDDATSAVGIASTQVLMVPGNHDVDWTLVTQSIWDAHETIRGLSDLEADKRLQSYFDESFDLLFQPMTAYRKFAERYDCAVWGKSPSWSVTFPLGLESELQLLGITTSLLSDSKDAATRLVVGTTQTRFEPREKNYAGMLLGHHPPDWWKDGDQNENHLRDYANVHLYGHKHIHRVSQVDNSVRLFASAVHPERETDWAPGYSWLRVSTQDELGPDPMLFVEYWQRHFFAVDNHFRSMTQAGGWTPDSKSVHLDRWARTHATSTRRAEREAAEAAGDTALAPGANVTDSADGASIEVAEEVVLVTDEPAPSPLTSRAPLTDAAGKPQRVRTAVYKFGDLGYADQMRLLGQFGLLRDNDRDVPHNEAVLLWFARLETSDVLDRFISAIEELVPEDESGN